MWGVRVLLEARLGTVRVPLQIDVGLGDAIVPAPEELEYPTLLSFPASQIACLLQGECRCRKVRSHQRRRGNDSDA